MTLACTNPDCTENGIPKELVGMDAIPPGVVMSCGACGQPCETTEPEPEPPTIDNELPA